MEQVRIIWYEYRENLEKEINNFLLSGKVYKCLNVSIAKHYACILYEPNLKHIEDTEEHICELCGKEESYIKNNIYKCLICNPN